MASIPIQRTQAWRHLSTDDKVELMVAEFDEFEVLLKEVKSKLNQLLFAVVGGLFIILAALISMNGIHP